MAAKTFRMSKLEKLLKTFDDRITELHRSANALLAAPGPDEEQLAVTAEAKAKAAEILKMQANVTHNLCFDIRKEFELPLS